MKILTVTCIILFFTIIMYYYLYKDYKDISNHPTSEKQFYYIKLVLSFMSYTYCVILFLFKIFPYLNNIINFLK